MKYNNKWWQIKTIFNKHKLNATTIDVTNNNKEPVP